MADVKKISDLTSTTLVGTDQVEIYRPSEPTIPYRGALGDIGLGGISVKDAPYNAAGNGTTDDLAALQAASDAAQAAGVPLWIPPGVYRITGTWHIGGPQYITPTGGSYTGINNLRFSREEWDAGIKSFSSGHDQGPAAWWNYTLYDQAAAKPSIDVWGAGPGTTTIWGDFTTGATEDDKVPIIAVWMPARVGGPIANVQVGTSYTIGNFTIMGTEGVTLGSNPNAFDFATPPNPLTYKQVGLFCSLNPGRFVNISGHMLHCLIWCEDCYGSLIENIQGFWNNYTVVHHQANGARIASVYDFNSLRSNTTSVMFSGFGCVLDGLVSQHPDTSVWVTYGVGNWVKNMYVESYSTSAYYAIELGNAAGLSCDHTTIISGYVNRGGGGGNVNTLRMRNAPDTTIIGLRTYRETTETGVGSMSGTSSLTLLNAEFSQTNLGNPGATMKVVSTATAP